MQLLQHPSCTPCDYASQAGRLISLSLMDDAVAEQVVTFLSAASNEAFIRILGSYPDMLTPHVVWEPILRRIVNGEVALLTLLPQFGSMLSSVIAAVHEQLRAGPPERWSHLASAFAASGQQSLVIPVLLDKVRNAPDAKTIWFAINALLKCGPLPQTVVDSIREAHPQCFQPADPAGDH